MEYPPDFLVEEFTKFNEQGHLFDIRFFDKKFEGGFPAGQVELGVWDKDADSLDVWLTKHSGPGSRDDASIYYEKVMNQQATTVDGRPALSFDREPASEVSVVHHVAFFSGSRVLDFRWYSDDQTYSQIIEEIFNQMIDSFQD